MNVEKSVKMTADEFIAWGLRQDSGRYELEKGEVLKMSPERTGHGKTKFQLAVALDAALRSAGIEGEVYPDGMAVPIDGRTVFEPDALLRLGPPLGNEETKVTDPLIVAEVLSPSTERRDSVTKLEGYFRLPSVRHYLIVDAADRRVIHHARSEDGTIRTAILGEGTLRLEPPGLVLDVGALFERL